MDTLNLLSQLEWQIQALRASIEVAQSCQLHEIVVDLHGLFLEVINTYRNILANTKVLEPVPKEENETED